MQRSRVSHHPCHRLSVPSAKRFWCRHCMMVFEDAITRWRHSRSCRSGGVDSLVRRREIETQSLQKMAETLDPDMVPQITVPREDGSSKDLCCFICRQRFVSLDDMREHVKYPCNKPSAIPRNHPMPLNFFPEPTFGTGIQQHYTDGPVLQSYNRAQGSSSASTSDGVTVYVNEAGEPQQQQQGQAAGADSEAKPTNIYVNENGETVIEVENLDLNTKSGELSLAHLLTQLSQQGIVFDHQPQGETEVVTTTTTTTNTHHQPIEVDFSQPTAVDAANTLTQLAGSAYRAVNNASETYTPPPAKRIKTEEIEVQYQHMEQPQYQHIEQHQYQHIEQPQYQHIEQPVVQQTQYLQKEEPYVEEESTEKYIICTNESDVIRVMRADDVPPENSGGAVTFQNGDGDIQNSLSAGQQVEQTVLIQGQTHHPSHTQQAGDSSSESNMAGRQMIFLRDGQAQLITHPGDDGSTQIVVEKEQHTPPSIVQAPAVEYRTMTAYAGPEGSVAVMEQSEEPVALVEQQGTTVVMTQQGAVEMEQQQQQQALVHHHHQQEHRPEGMIEQGTVAVNCQGSVSLIKQQDAVMMQQQEEQGSVTVVEQEEAVSVIQPDGTITVVQQEGGAVSVQQEGTVAAEMHPGGTVIVQQESTVAVQEGAVPEMQAECATAAIMQQEGSVSVQEGTLSEMQPEGAISVVHEESTVSVQADAVAELHPEGSVAVMQEGDTVMIEQAEGMVRAQEGVVHTQEEGMVPAQEGMVHAQEEEMVEHAQEGMVHAQEAGIVHAQEEMVVHDPQGTVVEMPQGQDCSSEKDQQTYVVVSADSVEAQEASDSAVSGLLEMSAGGVGAAALAVARDCHQGGAVVADTQSALLLPQIVPQSVTSGAADQVPQVHVQQPSTSE